MTDRTDETVQSIIVLARARTDRSCLMRELIESLERAIGEAETIRKSLDGMDAVAVDRNGDGDDHVDCAYG